MIDIGEDLVGAYLSRVIGCDLVQFNTRTKANQGEIDVVGLKLEQNAVAEAWFCEVSTHTRGLGGYRGEAASKMLSKVSSVKAYADSRYPGVRRHIEIWSPKVSPGMLAKVESALTGASDVDLVMNEEYLVRVKALCAHARKETAFSDSPSFRLLQILACLPESPF